MCRPLVRCWNTARMLLLLWRRLFVLGAFFGTRLVASWWLLLLLRMLVLVCRWRLAFRIMLFRLRRRFLLLVHLNGHLARRGLVFRRILLCIWRRRVLFRALWRLLFLGNR